VHEIVRGGVEHGRVRANRMPGRAGRKDVEIRRKRAVRLDCGRPPLPAREQLPSKSDGVP
jgi:hypothetical protein